MTGRNALRLAPASTAIASHPVPVYCSHCHIGASFDRWQAAIAADAVPQGHREWVAAGRPGALAHEEAMAELPGGGW